MKIKDEIHFNKLLEDLSAKDYDTRWLAAEVIGTKRNLSHTQIEHIVEVAKISDIGEVLIWGLGIMRAEGMENLISSFLEHPIDYFRWRAAEALRDLGTEAAISQLSHYLQNSVYSETRWKCAWALGEIGEIESFRVLWDAARDDKDRQTRWKAVRGITKLRGDVESIVKNKIKDHGTSEYMAWRSAWVLGIIGGIDTVQWLEELKVSSQLSPYVNYQVSFAIDQINKRILHI